MKRLAIFTILMLMVLGISQAQKTTFVQVLVGKSELVLEGEIVGKKSNWSPDKAFIYTENLVKIDKLFKGQVTNTMISVITKGGEIGDDMQIHTHYSSLAKGQTGIFYLSTEMDLPRTNKLFRLTQEEGGFQKIEGKNMNPYVITAEGMKLPYKKIIESILLETKKPILTQNMVEHSMKMGGDIDCKDIPFPENQASIEFTFDNVYLTNNNQYVEFDIMAKVNASGLKFGKAELFVTYNSEPFGEYVVQNSLIEIQKETIITDAAYGLTYQDFDATSFGIKIEPSGVSSNFYTLTTVKEKLVHVKLKVSDFSQIGAISFDDIDVRGRVWYYCDGEIYLFDEVNLGNPIFGVNPNPGKASGITYTFENVIYNENTSQYEFGIYATATGQTYFSDAYIYVSFNTAAFLPNQVTNGDVVFLPGPLISNDVVFNFQLTDNDPNTIFLLIYSEFPINQTDLTILGTTPKLIGTMYLKVQECEEPANLHFLEDEMQNVSYHNVGTMPFPIEEYDPIIASDQEEAKICCTDNPVITSFTTPGNQPIAAGMGQILTINGNNFGLYSSETKIRFKNGDVVTGEWMEVAPGDFIWGGINHWSDTKIEVVVPSVDKDEAWTKPAASGKFQLRTDCGSWKDSPSEIEIPYSLLNFRSGSFNQGKKIVLKNTDSGGVVFKYSSNVPNGKVKEAFEEALQEWCMVTNINFSISDEISNATSAAGNDNINLIVMEVSSGAASFVLSTQHTQMCMNSGTNETGYFLRDLDFRIDPSNTSLDKQQIKNRLLHELGHAHMLNHAINLSDPQDLMYYQEANPANAATIMNDDETGANLVFGNSAQILDGTSCGTPIGQGACGGTNAVSSVFNDNAIEVHPNPFYTSINISLLSPSSNEVTFEVFDQFGKRLLYKVEKTGQFEFKLTPPKEIPNGLYFLKTTIGESSSIVTKIIKL